LFDESHKVPGQFTELPVRIHKAPNQKPCSSRAHDLVGDEGFEPPTSLTVVVRTRGLEPPQDCSHYHLKVARLPIPPRPRVDPDYLICFGQKTQDITLAAREVIVEMLKIVVVTDDSFDIVK
jgi:hypothetical protein